MELPESKAKKRMLPTWMNETKTDGKECRSKRVKKKKKPLLRSPKKQVVYCMNEAELVEVALEVLNRSYKKEDTVENMLKVESDSDSPSVPAELQESSRTTKDTTHRPIENSPSSPLESDLQDFGSRDPLDEDDDPLKFVREIFFN
ncbi:cell cycle regulator of non-homologous end joining [Pleurodeles waltl]|uniref:cell cycle regulator of non-homologous end joining n=1 Tax=Pleurodeles waltl TaxID=8319 RepID=UPI0037097805